MQERACGIGGLWAGGGGRGGKVRYVQGRMLMGRTRGKVRCLGLQGRTGLQLPLEGWERGVQRWGWGGV